jgi:alpha-D-ribose 1-methylphosphonate 5-triphosphate diphosphatase
MKPDQFFVENGTVVLPERIMDNAVLVIEEGRIAAVENGKKRFNGARRIDASGCLVLPGLVDLHSDALERELEPRPNAFFPTEMVLRELDKKLAAAGITTIYHAISFAEGEIGTRSNGMAKKLVETINELADTFRVRTRIHARYELTDIDAVFILENLIAGGAIDMLSFMDHTPGQGQFREVASFHRYYSVVYDKTDKDISALIEKKQAAHASTAERLIYLLELCRPSGIPLASHDDDSQERLSWLKRQGEFISEFPVNLEAARAAHGYEFSVCMGAPNALRGRSVSGNLSAREAIEQRLCNILCSDYAPSALLQGALKLFDIGVLTLSEAINMVSLNPARAVGIDRETGSLDPGKAADFLLLKKTNGYGDVTKTFLAGKEIYSTCWR